MKFDSKKTVMSSALIPVVTCRAQLSPDDISEGTGIGLNSYLISAIQNDPHLLSARRSRRPI